MRSLQRYRRISVTVVIAASLLLSQSQWVLNASATYDKWAAVRYADNYALQSNPAYVEFGNDCTNFVSQSLHAGGYSSDWGGTYGDQQDYRNWDYSGAGTLYPSYTNSWINSGVLRQFLIWDYPGGFDWGTRTGTDSSYLDGLDAGDVLFYSMHNNGIMDHMTIQSWDLNTPYDVVDGHSNGRWHANWTLQQYNNNASTTLIYLVHIDPNND